MESNKKLLALALASMVALSAMGGALAAAPTVDSETSESSTTSDLVAGGNVDSFNASSDRNSAIEGEFDSTNASINITHPETGFEVADWSTSDLNQTYSDAANNSYRYRINFSHDELADVPVTAGESETITVHLINDTSVDDPDVTEFNVTLNATNERTVRVITDDTADSSDVDMMSESQLIGDDVNYSTVEKDNVGIANGSTDVYFVYANDTVSSDFTSATEADDGFFSFFSMSDPSSEGTFLQKHTLMVNDKSYAVFNSNLPDWVDESTGMTYGTTTTVDGMDATKIHLSDEDFDGETELDSAQTKAGKDFFSFASITPAKTNTFGGYGYVWGGTGGALLGGLLLFGHRRRKNQAAASADGGAEAEA
jgi:hypothetical protein